MSEYAKNLIRRAFELRNTNELKQSDITRFIQSRVSSADRYAALAAMQESGELSRHFVEPPDPRRAHIVLRRERVIASKSQTNDGRKIKPSGASQRRTKLARELIASSQAQLAALKESTALIRQLTEVIRARLPD